jgi:spore photoproduct lyase
MIDLQQHPYFSLLTKEDQKFVAVLRENYRLSFSEQQQLIILLRDIQMWQEPSARIAWQPPTEKLKGKDLRRVVLSKIREYHRHLAALGQDYNSPETQKSHKNLADSSGKAGDISDKAEEIPGTQENKLHFVEITDQRNILGSCPVASEKTRCCNLLTLDAVFRCGYDCSYCSIQSFYSQGEISFHGNLKEKLQALELDPQQTYHIGTGQSSDSLMWGNRQGLLDNLRDFAKDHENVILELKTKSANVSWALEQQELPYNMLFTWSLNTPDIITQEERGSATLDERLTAARTCADRGIPVGFHFHPMVRYRNWRRDYTELFRRIKGEFRPEEVVLISLGTLTYIKPVLKKIRQRDFQSAILRMPMEEIAGKYSYPFEQKKELFQLAMDELGEWQDQVFFYLCMEDKELWQPIFGMEYADNESFEEHMKARYFSKIRKIRTDQTNRSF